jgi:hypothetical protein
MIKQQRLKMTRTVKIFAAILLAASVLSACKKDKSDEPELPKPTIEDVELGLGNTGIAVIGADFHFDANIVAADKIEKVEVKIVQKSDETYSKPWSHEIVWTQYKDLKNTKVHKHFTIPADAAEGKYNFYVNVYDQNGSKLELKRDFAIYTTANLPVNPVITMLNLTKNWQPIFDTHGMNENPVEKYAKGDTLTSQINIAFVKGDGILYMLLIKKSLNHHPTTVEQIDFTKAIVYDVYQHKNEAEIFGFSNSVVDFSTDPWTFHKDIPEFKIGAEHDNNAPVPNSITGSKAWESGEYNLVVIYKNTTYNKTIHKSVPFNITYN